MKNLLVKYFSKQVILKRIENNLTQLELAEVIDCHLNTIGNIESGKSNLSLEMASKLSKALNISLDEIIDKVLQDVEI